jgi:hypothetical protein
MQTEQLQTRVSPDAEYLDRLQALALEISVAMEAIAANRLHTLKESVATQELLSASLAVMTHQRRNAARSSSSTVEQEIREASIALLDLNSQYAAVLRHSGRSIALLASLARNHTGQFEEARGSRGKYQTWSCEM